MDDELDENIQNGLNKLEKRFHELQELLDELMGENGLNADQMTDGMAPVEKAKYYGCVAYAMQTLYAVYLRLNNEETRKEESDAELTRIHGAILKIKNAINAKNKSDDAADKDEQEEEDEDEDYDIAMIKNEKSGPRMRVDIPAAQRFIAHNVDKEAREKIEKKFGKSMKKKQKGKNSKKKKKKKKSPKKTAKKDKN